jgi:hypothetical protein
VQQCVSAPRPPLLAALTQQRRRHRKRIRAHHRPQRDRLGHNGRHAGEGDALRDEIVEQLALREVDLSRNDCAGETAHVLAIDHRELLR